MTLEEKIDMVTGELCGRFGFFNRAIPRVGIPALTMADGPAGIRINDVETNDGRATALKVRRSGQAFSCTLAPGAVAVFRWRSPLPPAP